MQKRKLIYTLVLFTGLAAAFTSCSFRLWPKRISGAEYQDLHVAQDLNYPDSPIDRFVSDTQKNKSHYVTVLNRGDDALLAILHLIRNAQKTIFIQTFIWSADESGRFVTYELVQAAERGVKVKIIIDHFLLLRQPQLIAFLANAHPNLEVKLYNPLSSKVFSSKLALIKKIVLNFRGLNQRMHNKVFIVDDRIGILGGRNYENDYYDRGIKSNFKDCDVLIIGPSVKEMTDSFTEYWGYRLSVSAKNMRDIRRSTGSKKYEKYASRRGLALGDMFEELEECESNKDSLKKRLFDTCFKVEKIQFVADKPGKNAKIGKHKLTETTYVLSRFLQEAKESIVMQTPYLVTGKKSTKYFKKLAKDKPDVEFLVSTNSLSSADHPHAYAFSYKNKKKYLKKFRWQIFEFKLSPEDIDLMISPITKESRSKDYKTTVHSKVYVVDRKKVWIGSFNLDPRSINLNTEVGVIIDDERVARFLEKDIRRDMANQNSWTIGKRKDIPIISMFSGLLANIMELIPVIDIWPFTYSGSFELKPGKSAVPFFHEDFYERYKYVGPFPEVSLTEKEITARLIKSFMGPAEPLI